MLDGGPSRFYEVALSNDGPMTLIATDSNLLAGPLVANQIGLGAANRRDINIDFSVRPQLLI